MVRGNHRKVQEALLWTRGSGFGVLYMTTREWMEVNDAILCLFLCYLIMQEKVNKEEIFSLNNSRFPFMGYRLLLKYTTKVTSHSQCNHLQVESYSTWVYFSFISLKVP